MTNHVVSTVFNNERIVPALPEFSVFSIFLFDMLYVVWMIASWKKKVID